MKITRLTTRTYAAEIAPKLVGLLGYVDGDYITAKDWLRLDKVEFENEGNVGCLINLTFTPLPEANGEPWDEWLEDFLVSTEPVYGEPV